MSTSPADWRTVAGHRRLMLAGLILAPTWLSTMLVAEYLPDTLPGMLRLGYLVLFGVLLAWISAGFWVAASGFVSLLRRGDRYTLLAGDAGHTVSNPGRTAILMPVYHEDPSQVFASIRAMYLMLSATGRLDDFDFHVLSDSRKPESAVAEEMVWAETCRELNAFGRIFYRRRTINHEGKAGNVAEFCRRWGKRYPFLLVLDADSLMSGETIVQLVQLMARNPKVGLIQTIPMAVNRQTFFARAQQFTQRLHGPVFAAGLHFWQLGDSNYWGHNAIIRTAAFMAHCGLPQLPGRVPLGGPILSHDFVEAALLRRAGWQVWLAPEIRGSYEETPPTLPDHLARDRRWCRGNLQHAKLLLAEGLHPMSRVHFLNGILAYLSAPLWAMLLLLGTFAAAIGDPIEESVAALPSGIFTYTLILLLLPKLFGPLLLLREPMELRRFGGTAALGLGVLIETLWGALMAPVLMVAHSRFVLATLSGKDTRWGSQRRQDRRLGWAEAFRYFRFESLLGIGWGLLAWRLDPVFFLWLSPVLLGLVLAAPLAVMGSSARLGRGLGALGIFLTPEESCPPYALKLLRTLNRQHYAGLPETASEALREVLINPSLNALHVAMLRLDSPSGLEPRQPLATLEVRVRDEGPEALSETEIMRLLRAPESLLYLHWTLWEKPATPAAENPAYLPISA
ncbi:glucans biosynthesis glucosyltransferase MdoH [Thermithiobacillus plumbiphilus]|uniref:Glucans biosynthesis glucosyltransferase H n=1 Tax=Thermithiobacillus plumbiphilus TaxID=1729899 RepID=A0ABU9D921_9PROT